MSMTSEKPRDRWRWHESSRSRKTRLIIMAVVIGVVAGFLVGVTLSKAGAAPGERERQAKVPLCNEEFVCGVVNAADGVNKAKDGRLGRNIRTATYNSADADVIVNALLRRQGRMIARGKLAPRAALSRAEMWAEFRRDDNCVYKKSGTGSGTWPPQARWSCQWGTAVIPDLDLNSGDVRGLICSGGAGVAVGVTLAASAGGPPAWIGIGTGWLTCMFQKVAEDAADN